MAGINPLRWLRAALDWLCCDRPDYQAHKERRRTPRYRRRLGLCKQLWIVSGILMILYPRLPYVLALALATTFLCFAILDESERD